MTRPEPISHGAHSPVADTASPATGQPVTDHTATPAPHHAITRHRDRCDDHDDPGPGRVADHTARTVAPPPRRRPHRPARRRAPSSASSTPTATAAPPTKTRTEPAAPSARPS